MLATTGPELGSLSGARRVDGPPSLNEKQSVQKIRSLFSRKFLTSKNTPSSMADHCRQHRSIEHERRLAVADRGFSRVFERSSDPRLDALVSLLSPRKILGISTAYEHHARAAKAARSIQAWSRRPDIVEFCTLGPHFIIVLQAAVTHQIKVAGASALQGPLCDAVAAIVVVLTDLAGVESGLEKEIAKESKEIKGPVEHFLALARKYGLISLAAEVKL